MLLGTGCWGSRTEATDFSLSSCSLPSLQSAAPWLHLGLRLFSWGSLSSFLHDRYFRKERGSEDEGEEAQGFFRKLGGKTAKEEERGQQSPQQAL